MHQRQKPKNIIIDTITILFVVGLLGMGVVYFDITVSLAATLIVGIWVLDGFLKRTYGFDSNTMFADLTLASFGYCVSYAIGLLSLNSDLILQSFILTFLVFLTWIANLSLCRIFKMRPDNKWAKPIAWVMSGFFAVLSVFIAFYPLFV